MDFVRGMLHEFQPAPPVGAETRNLRVSRDAPPDFNPLRPWGRRHEQLAENERLRAISTRSARGGGDLGTAASSRTRTFQPAPPVGAETPSRAPSPPPP